MILRLIALMFIVAACAQGTERACVTKIWVAWEIIRVYAESHPDSPGDFRLRIDVVNNTDCEQAEVDFKFLENLQVINRRPIRFRALPNDTNSFALYLKVPTNDTSGLRFVIGGCDQSSISGRQVYFVTEPDTVKFFLADNPHKIAEDLWLEEQDRLYAVRRPMRKAAYRLGVILSEITWTSHEVRGKTVEKGSMLVPIQFKGSQQKLYAQLDSGCDHTPFYGPALRALDVLFDSTTAAGLAFKWHDLDEHWSPKTDWIDAEKERWVWLRWDMGQGADPNSADPLDRIVGTIGLDQIIDRVLILDFPGAQFAVVDDTALVDPIVIDTVHYVPATVEYNKFYVDVVVGEDTLKRVRFDTGSSSETLILPKDLWQKVTGITGDEEGIKRDSVMSWGNYVPIMTAPATGDMTFGPITIPNPPVTCVDWPDPTMTNMLLMGNAPFVGSFVVVLDCIGNRFGVSRVEQVGIPAHAGNDAH